MTKKKKRNINSSIDIINFSHFNYFISVYSINNTYFDEFVSNVKKKEKNVENFIEEEKKIIIFYFFFAHNWFK